MELAETELGDGRALRLVRPSLDDASVIAALIVEAFGNRPPVEPPPPALSETPERVADALASGFGVLAEVDGEPAGVVIVSIEANVAGDAHRADRVARRQDPAFPNRERRDEAVPAEKRAALHLERGASEPPVNEQPARLDGQLPCFCPEDPPFDMDDVSHIQLFEKLIRSFTDQLPVYIALNPALSVLQADERGFSEIPYGHDSSG